MAGVRDPFDVPDAEVTITNTNTLDGRPLYDGALEMDLHQNYAFDVSGVLHVPGVLGAPELRRLNAAADAAAVSAACLLELPGGGCEPFRELLVEPRLVALLNQLVGPGYRLDRPPQLLQPSAGGTALRGGNERGEEPRDPARAYYHQNGHRYCQTVRAFWALTDIGPDDGGLRLVPCTHRANVPTPPALLTGALDSDPQLAMVTSAQAMQAGDLLLVAGDLLQGERPWRTPGLRLLGYDWCGRAAIGAAPVGPAGAAPPSPAGHAEVMTPEQQAATYTRGYRATVPPPALQTDGRTVKLLPTGSPPVHPAVYRFDPGAAHIDHGEYWFWETFGYLVVPRVMDPAWLAAANATLDAHAGAVAIDPQDDSAGSPALAGTKRPTLGGLLGWGAESEPFARMVAHPAVQHRVQWMGGSGVVGGSGAVMSSVLGTSGQQLHTNGAPVNPARGYHYQNGRSYCEAVTVCWQLRDVLADLGGFTCVPGSHKAAYRCPRGVQLCTHDPQRLGRQLPMPAGSVIFFMDGALVHGTRPWRNPIPRRAVLAKLSSRSFNRSGGALVEPAARWGGAAVAGMTDAQLAVMRGPDRDVFDANVPRLAVVCEAGEPAVQVSYKRGHGDVLYAPDAPTGPVAKL
jgi:ectoine hydroxylase-related dioxygenase (phytanoyl-CoA dioxygenase family)